MMIKKRYECCGRCNGIDDICIADRWDELYLTVKQIYLENPVVLYGIEVRHTKIGLEWLIGHYEYMLTVNPVNSLTGPARKQEVEQHMHKLIEKWKQHLELYEKQTQV